MNKINIEKVIDYSNILKENEKLKVINKELSKELHEARHTKYERYVVPEIERLNKGRETDIKYNKYLQKEIVRLHSIIKEAREYIENHCKNERISNEVGYACYTMADTNELEHIMKILGNDDE